MDARRWAIHGCGTHYGWKMADVFISYARVDRPHVAVLVEALKKNGLSVWWDSQIETGARFDESIQRELDAAQAAVVVWSPDSIASSWVKDEAGYALQHGKLVPVTIREASPPLGFGQLQTLSLSEDESRLDDGAVRHLIASLRERMTRPAKAIELPERGLRIKPTRTENAYLVALGFAVIVAGLAAAYFYLPLTQNPAAPSPAASAAPLRPAQKGKSLYGGDILRYYRSPSATACRIDCQRESECQGYTWIAANGYKQGDPSMCYLMATVVSATAQKASTAATRKPIPGLP